MKFTKSFKKNTYFEEHLRKTASICFTSEYYIKYWWRIWARRNLDRVQKFFLSVTILLNQMQQYNLYVSFFNISINILIKFLTLHAFLIIIYTW